MDDHFCPNCGTEVEADARFCPTCGTTLAAELEVEEAGVELPAAPAWPAAEPDSAPQPDEPPTVTDAGAAAPEIAEPAAEPSPAYVAPPRAYVEPPQAYAEPPRAGAPPSPAPTGAPPTPAELPITWPTTLSGWLIGGGSLLGAIFLIPRLGSAGYVVSLLLFLALLGIAATIFLADRVPEIPRLRLAVLATTMIGLGVALARAAFTIAGVDTLFLVAMLAAAGGALLIELDRDRPMPPSPRSVG
jgi:ribosomal protein S27AE